MSQNAQPHPHLRSPLGDLPCAENITFPDTIFGPDSHRHLPTPSEVRDKAKELDTAHSSKPDVVLFKSLGLIVKYGKDITIAEGQCIWFMRHHLQSQVPVPDIYGWRRDDEQTFLYLEYVESETLEERWPSLSLDERQGICAQLRAAIQSWRQLCQPDGPGFIGQISGQPLGEILFADAMDPFPGPFPSVKAFHDYFARFATIKPNEFDPRRDFPELAGLSDNLPIVFTHGDLHPSNILVSLPDKGPPCVVAIIDWHQSGWYPQNWEFLKARMTCNVYGEWVNQYLPRFLEPPDDAYLLAFEYTRMRMI